MIYKQMLTKYFKLFGMEQLQAEMCAIMVIVNKIELKNLVLVQCNIKYLKH